MRYLHPVAANEGFVASGVYKHYENEKLMPYTEAWTMHEVSGGARLIRIDQDARDTDRWSGLAEVLQDPTGRTERFNLLLTYTQPDAKIRTMKTDYVFLEQYVQITRVLNGGEPEYIEMALPAENVFVRLLDFHLFWGEALRARRAAEADRPVFVPFRRPDYPPGQVVTAAALPVIEKIADEKVTIGKKTYPVKQYQTRGDRIIRIDERGIPVLLQTRGTILDVLTDYAHR